MPLVKSLAELLRTQSYVDGSDILLYGSFKLHKADLQFSDDSGSSVSCLFSAGIDLDDMIDLVSSGEAVLLRNWSCRRSQTMHECVLCLQKSSILRILSPVILKVLGQTRTLNSSLMKHVIESQKYRSAAKKSGNIKESIANFEIISKLLKEKRNLSASTVEYLQSLTLIGIASRKSCLYQSKDSCFFMLDLTFANTQEHHSQYVIDGTLAVSDDSSDSVQLIFMGPLAPLFHRFLELGRAYLFKYLRMMVLFPKKENEQKILLFKEGKSSVSTVHQDSEFDFAECVPPSLAFATQLPVVESSLLKDSLSGQMNKENVERHVDSMSTCEDERYLKGLISFTGTVSKIIDRLWKIIELDGEYEVILSHCDEHIWKLLMEGQTITLRNVHYISDSEQDHKVTFGACGISQVEIVKNPCMSDAFVEFPFCNQLFRRFQGLLVNVPLLHIPTLKKMYYDLAKDLQLNASKNLKMFERCYSLLGKQKNRDVYAEFLNHSSKCSFSLENHFNCSILTSQHVQELFPVVSGMGLQVQTINIGDKFENCFIIGSIKNGKDNNLSLIQRNNQIPIIALDAKKCSDGSFVAIRNPTLVTESIGIDNQCSAKKYFLASEIELLSSENTKKTVSLEIKETSRLVFITQICDSVLHYETLESCVYGTSFQLKLATNEAKYHLENGSDMCINFISGQIQFRTGTWVIVNLKFENSGDMVFANYDKTHDSIASVDFSHRLISNREDQISIDLVQKFHVIVDTLESTYKNRTQALSVRRLLDAPETYFESEKTLSGAFLDQMVTFEGLLIEKGLRESDKQARGSGWYHTQENFDTYSIGLGIPGCILHFKIQDCLTADTIDVYYDNFKMSFTLGLIPGQTVVRIENAALKRSRTGSLFAHIIPCTQIRIIKFQEKRLHESINSFKVDRDNIFKRITEIKTLATINPRKSSQVVFHIVANIVKIIKITMKLTCEHCLSTIIKNKCSKCLRPIESKLNFTAEVNAVVCDGSRDALMTFYDSAALIFLNLTEKAVDDLRSACGRVGEISFQDFELGEDAKSESTNTNNTSAKHDVDMVNNIILDSLGDYESRQNLLIGCRSNLKSVKPKPNETLQRLANTFADAKFDEALAIRTFRINDIDVNTLVTGGLFLIGVEVMRIPANKLTELLLNSKP